MLFAPNIHSLHAQPLHTLCPAFVPCVLPSHLLCTVFVSSHCTLCILCSLHTLCTFFAQLLCHLHPAFVLSLDTLYTQPSDPLCPLHFCALQVSMPFMLRFQFLCPFAPEPHGQIFATWYLIFCSCSLSIDWKISIYSRSKSSEFRIQVCRQKYCSHSQGNLLWFCEMSGFFGKLPEYEIWTHFNLPITKICYFIPRRYLPIKENLSVLVVNYNLLQETFRRSSHIPSFVSKMYFRRLVMKRKTLSNGLGN